VRVGLATNARAVNISTAGRLLLASDEMGGMRATPEAVAVSRVRVEPRLFAPPSVTDAGLFRVEIAAVGDEDNARSIAREAEELTGETPEVSRDARSGSWRVRVGRPASRAESEELRARIEEAGIATFSVVDARAEGAATAGGANPVRPGGPNPVAARAGESGSKTAGGQSPIRGARQPGGLRPTSRASLPARGLVVYAGGASQLLNARAPVTFAAADEQSAPLRFNEKPYRGRLEVFTNLSGTLTVVNVVALEDYVRGVVPNELSPGGYPAVEALKAQAVAARTYAVNNRGQFRSAGFDLLPTIRSQVYGGKATEHPLATRAVDETRGVVATHAGRPINAVYTSTCGGHTEDGEKIFGGEFVPYLRGRACAVPALAHAGAQNNSIIRTLRDAPAVKDAERIRGPRDAALLAVHGLRTPARTTDDWLSDDVTIEEVRDLLALVARLSRRAGAPAPVGDAQTRPPGFASALAHAADGESRAAVLLDAATVEYILAFRDAADIPAANRADVAALVRDGHLTLFPDATLRPRNSLTRSRALRAAAGLLEARGLLNLQKATARPTTTGELVVRAAKGPERALPIAPEAYLFRAYGDALHPVRALAVAGGEPVAYHTDARGAVDYIEMRPAPNGASAERFSPFTNWTTTLTAAEVAQRLSRHAGRVGQILDLRVASRGVSGRALDLEVVGTSATAHVRGGRIRSALGLREQLFFIDRRYDEAGRITAYVFDGRGWGHGVGLCQVGAYGLARAGLTHDKILKHYYTGIELSKLY
jgi:stage II sporulation protein D